MVDGYTLDNPAGTISPSMEVAPEEEVAGAGAGGPHPASNGLVISSVGRLLRSTVYVLDLSLKAIGEAEILNVRAIAEPRQEEEEIEDIQEGEEDAEEVIDENGEVGQNGRQEQGRGQDQAQVENIVMKAIMNWMRLLKLYVRASWKVAALIIIVYGVVISTRFWTVGGRVGTNYDGTLTRPLQVIAGAAPTDVVIPARFVSIHVKCWSICSSTRMTIILY